MKMRCEVSTDSLLDVCAKATLFEKDGYNDVSVERVNGQVFLKIAKK